MGFSAIGMRGPLHTIVQNVGASDFCVYCRLLLIGDADDVCFGHGYHPVYLDPVHYREIDPLDIGTCIVHGFGF